MKSKGKPSDLPDAFSSYVRWKPEDVFRIVAMNCSRQVNGAIVSGGRKKSCCGILLIQNDSIVNGTVVIPATAMDSIAKQWIANRSSKKRKAT